MPQKSKRTKKKNNQKRKSEDDGEKATKQKCNPKATTSKNSDSLTTLFGSEEINRLKNILKLKDVSNISLIVAAVILNKLSLVQRLHQQGGNLNETGPNHTSALMWAIKDKNDVIIDYLLFNGADPTAKDDNGDNIFLLALENKLWDEAACVALLNHAKSIAFVDFDFTSKAGRSMIHMAVRREWPKLLDLLINEKVNVNTENNKGMTPLMLASYFNYPNIVNTLLQAKANFSKEDANQCTALCYGMSHAVHRNLAKPHLVVDKLLSAMKSSNVDFKSYMKSRIDLIFEDTFKQNKSGNIIVGTKSQLIPYALKYIDGSLSILIELNIFKKITHSIKTHMNKPLQIHRLLLLINELLNHCERFTCPGVNEKKLLETFIVQGGAESCLAVLKTFGVTNSKQDCNFGGLAFAPFVTTCTLQTKAKLWLESNYAEVLPFYEKYCHENSHKSSKASAKNQPKNTEKLAKFKQLMENIKLEKSKIQLVYTKISEESASDEASTDFLDLEETDKVDKETKPDNKSTTKITKQRRAKALKSKITKLRNEELTQRLNKNKTEIMTQKCVSDSSIAYKKPPEKVSIQQTVSAIEIESQESCNQSAWQQIWHIDDDSRPVIKEFYKTVNDLSNKILPIKDDDMFNINLDSMIYEVIEMPDEEENLLYSNCNEYEAQNNNCNSDNGTPKNSKSEPIFSLKDAYKTQPQSSREDIDEMMNGAIKYLSNLLTKIIGEYQSNWENEKNGEFEVLYEEGVENVMKPVIDKLEAEYIERVQKQFDSLATYLKRSANNHIFECSKVMDKLEEILLNHKIRGHSIINETPMQLVKTQESLSKSPSSSLDIPFIPYNVESIFQPSSMSTKIPSSKIDPCRIVEKITHVERKVKPKTYPDKSYLQQDSILGPKVAFDPKKRKLDRENTMASCYHLIPSILSICEDDMDDIIIKQQEKTKRQKLASTIRKRKTLHDTLLVMPKVNDPATLMESFKNLQAPTPTELDNSSSRWCNVIRNLQVTNDYITLDEIKVSIRTRCPHTMAPGGNFNPVALGLDPNDRPVAVKRILKCNPVCKVLKTVLNPLLGLRNINILHYHTCVYVDNELILVTPLCEYNLGEYIMEMKSVPNMFPKYTSMVKQLLAGLRFLHDRADPIVHGNLKPSNIFVDLNGVIRVAEFGMSKALYCLTEAANTSVIWFARETLDTFKRTSSLCCSCASDIQVAGMLIHFVLTAGKHPYGVTVSEIIKHLERGLPYLSTSDVDLYDLISWMLLYDPNERPAINQVVAHVFFWGIERKWNFILTCAGVSAHGTILNMPINDLHMFINTVASKENIKGRWLTITKQRFPELSYSIMDEDSIAGFLRFIRDCVQNYSVFRMGAAHYELRNFILCSFPALPLSLYRILDGSPWLNHHLLQPFTNVDSHSA